MGKYKSKKAKPHIWFKSFCKLLRQKNKMTMLRHNIYVKSNEIQPNAYSYAKSR